MTYAIQLDQFGGPEVLVWREIDIPPLQPGMVLVGQQAIGLNFIDTYHRSGLYPLELPAGLGVEAAGIVEAVGDAVDTISVGDRVAYVGLPPGAYAEKRIFPADRLVKLPDEISTETAAGAMLKGLTAWYLLRRSFPVKAGQHILLYAAAGGVGLIAAQWAASIKAHVIGVVSTDEKAALAKQNGCEHVVRSDDPDFVSHVRELTDGTGVAAVYDSVGKESFFQSLDCLKPHGMMVTYGNASGAVEPFSPMELARRGSLLLTRPVIFDFIRARSDLLAAAAELFGLLQAGSINININQTYPLQEAARAHVDLEARKTTGSVVLIP
jgi:NADPH2:quinone reductase